jgi:soluble lytic murein transglycosylase-like protein
MQLTPGTFAEALGWPASDASTSAMQDPQSNVRAGVRYLARAIQAQNGDLYWGIIGYRAGIEGAAAWRRSGVEPSSIPWPGPEIDARTRAVLETYSVHRPDVRLVFVTAPGVPAPLAKPVLPAGSC